MRRRRFQKGSLQLRKHADRRVWVFLYYDEKSKRRYHTLGWASEMNKGQADEKRQEFMREINGGTRTTGASRPPTVAEFLEEVYLPFYLGKWKESTAGHVGEPPPASHRKGTRPPALGRPHVGAASAVSGAKGSIWAVIQRCGPPPVGPLFDVRDGGFRKDDQGKPDCSALHSEDSQAE